MNATPDDLIDAVFGQLDDGRRADFDREATTDPALADRLDRLRRAVATLVDDGEDLDPPPGLAGRTLAFVADRAAAPATIEFAPRRLPFRWTDAAVAAGILLAGLITLVPAVVRQRQRMAQAGCSNNLLQVGQALNQYADAHGVYPYAAPDSPGSYVGSFGNLLQDAGYLPDGAALSCPTTTRPANLRPANLPAFREICEQERRQPGSGRAAIATDYAYHLGYRDGRGRPGPVSARNGNSPYVPILADAPPHREEPRGAGQILVGNSPSHGGGGQNVLFSDLHAAWRRNRWISDQDHDLYLNEQDRPVAGLHSGDSVLAPGGFRFDGRPAARGAVALP